MLRCLSGDLSQALPSAVRFLRSRLAAHPRSRRATTGQRETFAHSRTMSVIDALWSTRVVPMCRNLRYRPASEKSVGYMCRIYVLVEDHFDAANHAQVRPDALFWRVAIRECRDYRKVVSSPYRLLMWNCPPVRRAFFTPLRVQRRGALFDRAQITNGRKKK
jgi:hypothetical protein